MSLNVVAISGRIGSSRIPPNSSILVLRLAVRVWRRANRDEPGEAHTNWFTVVVPQQTVKGIIKDLVEGASIALSGSLEENCYQRDGKKVSDVRIFATKVELARPPKPSVTRG